MLTPPSGSPSPSNDGWRARLDLRIAQRCGRSVLTTKSQRGPLTVQRAFYPEGGVCHLYLLHPPGGVVGGDRLEIDLEVGEGAHVLITTPGAAKFYRSAGPYAFQAQRLGVREAAVLEWFPQENILFPGAMLRASTRAALSGDARFLGWEIHSLGRPALQERFDAGDAELRVDIDREASPLLRECLRLRGAEDLQGPSGLRGYPITATFVASATRESDLKAARDGVGTPAGVLLGMTRLGDLLVARCLAGSVENVRRTFLTLWGILRPRLLGRAACPPRIWTT